MSIGQQVIELRGDAWRTELRAPDGRWTSAGLSMLRALPAAQRRAYAKTGELPPQFYASSPGSSPEPEPAVLEGAALWASGEGMVRDVSPEEAGAARQIWFRDTFSYTNDYLRHGTLPSASAAAAIRSGENSGIGPRAESHLHLPARDDAEYIRSIGITRQLMERAPAFSRPAVMYRDITSPNDVFGLPGSMKGRTFTDPGFMSATADSGTAEKYGSEGEADKIIINVPAGGRAFRSQLAFSPDYAREKEYTFPPGARFRVDEDQVVNGGRQTTVTLVVPPGTPPGPVPQPVLPSYATRQPWEQFPGSRYNVETGEPA